MRILVLGGTRFLGRAVVEAALGRGHQVTLFNRGRTNPSLFPGIQHIQGDRTKDLSGLSDQRWDVVIDVAGFHPDEVQPTVHALVGMVDRYVFVSTVSVYADHSIAQIEGQPVIELRDGLDPGEAYGAGKAAAEQMVTASFGNRAFIVRPGLIVGPYDPTDRFAYWPRRIARGGRILAPGGPRYPTQFIDVRDLGSWIVDGAHQELNGVYNATGPASTLGRLLDECQRVIPDTLCTLTWVSDERLLAAGVNPWMGVPLWIAVPGWEAASDVDIGQATAAGLTCRPLAETIRTTLAWDLARGGPSAGAEGLTAERERELLETLDSARPSEG
jgi:2'-hydroxyisoflavone reductase